MTLNKEEFKEYLETLKAFQIVGFSRQSGCCPIAIYLDDKLGICKSEVEDAKYTINGKDFNSLPDWAIDFNIQIDSLPCGTKIIAQEAINILNRI